MPSESSGQELVRRGDAALGAGHVHDAAALYRRALALDAGQATTWFNLGWALRAARRFEEALAAYDEALARGIARPEEARINRAAILSDHLFRPDEAMAELQRALATAPDYVPGWLTMGLLHEDRGDGAAARVAYQRARDLAPGNGRAAARLGALAIAEDDAATAARQLTAALDNAAGPDDHAEMLFGLGDAFDRLGRYDDAFPAYEAANRIARSLATHRYDAAAHERLIDRIIAAPPPPQAAALRSDDEGQRPIFICGMFRSGSTLAERILSRHSSITAGGELEFVPALAASLDGYPDITASLSEEQLTGWRADYRRGLPAGGLVTDKRCDNFLHLGLIWRLFPAARVVHTHRAPLDNLLSIYCLHFGEGVTYGHDLREAAHYYVQCHRLMRHWHQVAGDRIHDFDYDALVSEPAPTITAALDFLGLDWEDAVLKGDRDAGVVRTASAWQVRARLNDRSSGRWRHYERQMEEPRKLLAAAGL